MFSFVLILLGKFFCVGSSGNISMSKLFHSHLTILHYRVHNERNFFIVLTFKEEAFSLWNDDRGCLKDTSTISAPPHKKKCKNLRNYFSVSYWFNCLNELQSKRWPTWYIPCSWNEVMATKRASAELLKFVIKRKLVFIHKNICQPWICCCICFFFLEIPK